MLSILTTFKICCSVRVKAYRSTYDVSSLNTSNLDKTNILLSSRVQLGVKETFVLGYAENLLTLLCQPMSSAQADMELVVLLMYMVPYLQSIA